MLQCFKIREDSAGRFLRYTALGTARAAIIFPYDAHNLKLVELYSLPVPILVPADVWMWAFTWTHANPAVMDDALAAEARTLPNATAYRHPVPPHCARGGTLHHFSPRVCHYWAAVSDFWRLPGLRHFRTVAELRAMLQEDQTPVLEVMRAAHEQSVREATEFWSWSIPLVLEGKADLARAECFPHGLGAHF